jgi:RNA polymerase-binding transcription factor DksA
MDEKKKKDFKERLEKMEQEHINIIEEMDEDFNGENVKESLAELSGYDNHPGDTGTELFFIEHINGRKSMYKDTLQDIEDAKKRIDKGKYGVCIECEKEIDGERLAILPQTNLCIDCALKKDETIKKTEESLRTKPVNIEDVETPYGTRKVTDPIKEGRDMGIFEDLMEFGSAQSPEGE